MGNFISAKWLYNHIKDNNLALVDCRADLFDSKYGRRLYNEGHIEGAQFLDVKKDLAGEAKEHGGRSPLPDLEDFKEKLQTIGISDDTIVVAYDEAKLAGAERLWWMLKYIGHDKVYVLNGGIKAWLRENNPLTVKASIKEKGKINIRLNKDLVIDIDELKESMDNEGFIIVDSRAHERYKGEIEPIDKKAGHIPGALNYHWKDVLKENGEFKSKEELKAHFRRLEMCKDIILHCGSGIDACGNFIAMSEISIKPKLYVGSWSDWVSYDNNPIVVSEKL
jgi:thiosulfate/3-mercaptopyruvate sulfurtransferase